MNSLLDEELKRKKWDEIDREHKEFREKIKKEINAPTYYQKIVRQQILKMHRDKRRKESENIPKDTRKYKWRYFVFPRLDFFPNILFLELVETLNREHYTDYCLYDGKPCNIPLEHTNCMYCSRNNEEYLDGGYKR